MTQDLRCSLRAHRTWSLGLAGVLVVCLALWLAMPALAQMAASAQPASSGTAQADPTGAALLDRMVVAYESAERLSADFFVESCVLTENTIKGHVDLERPRRLRVEFGTPPQKVYMAGGEGQFEYFPNEGKAYRYRDDTSFRPAQAYEIFLGMRRYLAYLRPTAREELGNGLARVRLVPADSLPYVTEVLFDIEEESGWLRRAVVKDADGARLAVIELEGYRRGAQWPEGYFEPPSDARIYTPMVERDFLNTDR
ncbi:LolA family protein [Oceanidesulfovibrio marinus]|nr:outer membrane lipoprotein carrier protein LolA [Oceanidesulfovibrio marinus]